MLNWHEETSVLGVYVAISNKLRENNLRMITKKYNDVKTTELRILELQRE